jgi:hypothetical protein
MLKEWRDLISNDDSARAVIATSGSKRKAVCTMSLLVIFNPTLVGRGFRRRGYQKNVHRRETR